MVLLYYWCYCGDSGDCGCKIVVAMMVVCDLLFSVYVINYLVICDQVFNCDLKI